MPVMKNGTMIVVIAKARVRTRSMYSRLKIAKNLSMAGHPRLDACVRGTDTIEEDLMEGRGDQLEALDARAGAYQSLQQLLRVGALCELDLEEAVVVVHLLHEPLVAQHVADAVLRAVHQRERDVALAIRRFDVGEVAIEHLLAARDDTHRVAHPLGVLH